MVIQHWHQLIRSLRKELFGFFARPYGGMEVEIMIAIAELWQAVALVAASQTMWNTRALQDFVYWGISAWLVAVPFTVASLLSLVGIVLFFRRNPACAPLRLYGSCLSSIIWSWLFFKTGFVLSWELGYVGTCFLFSIWSIRVMIAAKQRWQWRLRQA